MNPHPCAVPAASAIQPYLPGAHFHDAWQVVLPDRGLTALGEFARAAAATPPWVHRLMAVRNQAAAAVGLKHLGRLDGLAVARAEADYRPGDRVGIFTLLRATPGEVLLGDADRHLNVVVSVHRSADTASRCATVTVTTVVQRPNWLGRLYLLPVLPLHRRIVPAMLARVAATPA